MIRRNGPRKWNNIHVTMRLNLEDLIDIDNSNRQGHELDKYETLNQTSRDINDLVKEGLPLTEKQQTPGYFYNTYRKYFSKDFSYETFDSREIQAKYNKTIFNKINQEANKFRDRHIIETVKKQLDAGKRVFLIEGGWHAIVCEPAFTILAK